MSDSKAQRSGTGHGSGIGLTVTYAHGDAFEIEIRGHHLTVDQPVDAGGADLGPTPTELFAASLAACVGFYAERFLRRHGLAADGLQVHCRAGMSSELPARVATITLRLDGLPPLPDNRRAALLAVVDHCTVHNSIQQAPRIHVELAPTAEGSGRPALTAAASGAGGGAVG
jgi:putative redox protein